MLLVFKGWKRKLKAATEVCTNAVHLRSSTPPPTVIYMKR